MREKKDKISIGKLIQNVFFMIKYAGAYDRPLVVKIFIMNVI